MKKYLLHILLILLFGSTAIAVKNCKAVDALMDEINTYQRNERGLIDMVEHYRTCDSLSGARVDELTLSLDDALKVIDEDKQMIENLKRKPSKGTISRMESVAKTATKTEIKVVEKLRDTTIVKNRDIIYRDTIVKYVDVSQPYYDVHATIAHDTIDMDITTRDSLLIVEMVEYKRFLGFLWKTKRIKRRTFDVISKNPNTIIEDFKVVTIKM